MPTSKTGGPKAGGGARTLELLFIPSLKTIPTGAVGASVLARGALGLVSEGHSVGR